MMVLYDAVDDCWRVSAALGVVNAVVFWWLFEHVFLPTIAFVIGTLVFVAVFRPFPFSDVNKSLATSLALLALAGASFWKLGWHTFTLAPFVLGCFGLADVVCDIVQLYFT